MKNKDKKDQKIEDMMEVIKKLKEQLATAVLVERGALLQLSNLGLGVEGSEDVILGGERAGMTGGGAQEERGGAAGGERQRDRLSQLPVVGRHREQLAAALRASRSHLRA